MRLDIFTYLRKFIFAIKTLESHFAKVNSLYFAIFSARESFLLYSICKEYSNFQDSNRYFCDFKNFSNNAFVTAEFWCIVGLTAILL